jgi:Ca-activated chloride channel family protein
MTDLNWKLSSTRLMTLVLIASVIVFNSAALANVISISSGLATPVMEAGIPQNAYIRVALMGFEMDEGFKRPPLNVAIVLDQSGSMAGDKIARAREVAIMAVGKLSGDDVVSILTYDSTVDVLIPATKVSDKNKIYTAINTIAPRGGTALFAGTSKGAYEVRKFLSHKSVNRVVLLSDGLANVGPDSPSELGALGKALAKDGMTVSTIGLGLGYNEDLMTELVDYSDGSHDFVENSADLVRIFDREFGDAMSVVAQGVEIEVVFDESIRPIRIIGREGEIIGNRVFTRMNQLYSAQENYVVLEVALPAQQVGQRLQVAKVNVQYNNMASNKRLRLSDQVFITFTASKQQVIDAINTPIYEAAIEQIANEETEKALELRDNGDVRGAAELLKNNSSFLQLAADLISSPKLQRQSRQSLYEAAAIEKQEDWNKTRKTLKEKSYKRAKQQEKDEGDR